MITLYGIPNCDTVKKARDWLSARGVDYAFHDYKKAGVDAGRIAGWARQVGWQLLLNRAGTTFRKLPDADKADLDADKAAALMATHPSCIKRPVVEVDGKLIAVGFKPDEWEEVISPDL